MSHQSVRPFAFAAAGLSIAATLACASTALADGPFINEIRTGQPGPDLDEYFEIRGTPGTVLNDVWYVVVGDDDSQLPPAQNGYVEFALNLTGITIPASGFLVVAESTFTLGVADVTTNLVFEDNSNTTHLLVTGFTGGVGTDIDTNDDGVQDVTPWSAVLSSVALVAGPDPDGVSGNFVYSTNQVGPDGFNVPAHVYLCQNTPDYKVASVDPTVGDDTPGAASPTCASTIEPLRISEIRIDQAGTDNDEYFELSGTPGTSLNGYTYIVIGDGTGGSGVIEAVISLNGFSIPSDGYFLVTEPTFTLAPGAADFVTATNGLNFENTDNVTHLLVKDFTGTNGQDLDTNNDGVLDVTPWSEVTDSVAVIIGTPGVGGNEFVYSPVVLGPDGGFAPSAVYRCYPYGDWKIGTFDPAAGIDTPGAQNYGCPSCGGGGSCFGEHAGAGCDLVDCCGLVCNLDPACCLNGWDATCVSTANSTCLARGRAPSLSINEVRIGQSGADTDEYVEIVGTPGTSLNGVSYVVIGDGIDANGVVESVSLLSGTIPADGYFVVAKSTFTLGVPDLVRESMNFEDGDSVTHMLVFNFNGNLGLDLDTNNDCTLDLTPWSSVIDSVALTAPDFNCVYSTTTVGPDGSFSPAHAYKCSTDGTWTIGLFDSLANDTPGGPNAACPPPDPCGPNAPQDCYTVAGTPGCNDAACCNAMCELDPTCCSVAWDADCVALANRNCFVPPNPPAVKLSEMRIDQVGTDTDEYFELYGDANQSLNGLTYVVIGDGAAIQGSGVVEMAVPLQGYAIPADGFFLAAKSSFTLTGATPDFVVETGFNFENSDSVTHMLVWNFTGAVGDDLDTNDDGVLDVTPWTSIVDSVALVPPTLTELVYSDTIVGPDGAFVPSHVKYCPSTNAWTLGTFDPTTSDDSPGVANPGCTYAAPCPADLTHDGVVDASDLGVLLGAWGVAAGDLTGDGTTDASDLGVLLGAWGPC
ncbi:MAG: hypothetical protein U0572_16305 [Phycisphaerales bacterium]